MIIGTTYGGGLSVKVFVESSVHNVASCRAESNDLYEEVLELLYKAYLDFSEHLFLVVEELDMVGRVLRICWVSPLSVTDSHLGDGI
uniref:Uncharacterized protein n=1 Tax=Noccaea caerulescens TaxID=107243 RepID=A0A1J3GVA0_NOCCA